ncbi:MAG: outer membrane lipoprotein-sorting protein [Rubrivivax sp.]|nr:outer membrane lipoprotein-sorting protein [Rubrivivax sp.]
MATMNMKARAPAVPLTARAARAVRAVRAARCAGRALALLGALTTGAAAAATDVAAMLQAADRYRSGSATENLQVETQVTVLNRDGSTDKERRYTVFVQAGHKSLVLMRSPAEAGQKVLMLGDDFWLLLPGSQRPVRITPTQKLLGDASTGDIATLSWASDYTGTVVGEERCPPAAGPGSAGGAGGGSTAAGPAVPCLHLSLQAARKGLSYARIELWLGAKRHEPLRAELYVQSDKLAKLATFVLEPGPLPARVDEMVLADRLASRKETRVRYLSRQARQVPETWLNPMFLARNPSVE